MWRKTENLHRSWPNWYEPAAAGLAQALAAVPRGHACRTETGPAGAVGPGCPGIADELEKRGVKLALGASVHDPTDPMGKMFFNILATFAEFEADLVRMRTKRHGHCPCQGTAEGQTKAIGSPSDGIALLRRMYDTGDYFDQRSGRAVRRLPADRLSGLAADTERR